MSNITDPSGPGSEPRSTPASGVGAGELPELASMPPEAGGEVYRSLSVLATAALILAGLYVLVVVVGELASLYTHTPLLLPLWTFLLPATALLLAWVARAQIQGSEGTLVGLSLTRWGMALSAVFGICYAAQYAATALAVQQQAKQFAARWLDELCKGEVDRAFWMTVPPPQRPFSRDDLEILQINSNDFTKQGTLSAFHLQEYVRLLGRGGADTKIELEGVTRWEYEKGGHNVTLNYSFQTPLAVGKLVVTVHGVESRENEFQGRQWFVFLPNTGVRVNESVKFSQDLQPVMSLMPSAGEAAQRWLNGVCDGELLAPYLATCPPGERDRLAAARHSALLAGLATGREVPLPGVRPDDVRRWNAFVQGDLVRADPATFWTVPERKDGKDVGREKVIAEVKSLFAPLEPRRFEIKLAMSARLPLWSQDGNHWRFRLDYQLTFQQRNNPETPLLVEMRVVVAANVANPGRPGNVTWQVEGMELLRARTMPHPGRQGPGR